MVGLPSYLLILKLKCIKKLKIKSVVGMGLKTLLLSIKSERVMRSHLFTQSLKMEKSYQHTNLGNISRFALPFPVKNICTLDIIRYQLHQIRSNFATLSKKKQTMRHKEKYQPFYMITLRSMIYLKQVCQQETSL